MGTAAVSSDDHHTDFEAQFDELTIKPILAQLRQDFIMEFSDPNILNFKLDVTVVDEMGKEKIGSGNGVLRDAISEFWTLFFLAALDTTLKRMSGRQLVEYLFKLSTPTVISSLYYDMFV